MSKITFGKISFKKSNLVTEEIIEEDLSKNKITISCGMIITVFSEIKQNGNRTVLYNGIEIFSPFKD
jgi:hypothetical protein